MALEELKGMISRFMGTNTDAATKEIEMTEIPPSDGARSVSSPRTPPARTSPAAEVDESLAISSVRGPEEDAPGGPRISALSAAQELGGVRDTPEQLRAGAAKAKSSDEFEMDELPPEHRPQELDATNYSLGQALENGPLHDLAATLSKNGSGFKIDKDGTILNPKDESIGSMKNGIITMAPGTVDQHIQMLKEAGVREVIVKPENHPDSQSLQKRMNTELAAAAPSRGVFGDVARAPERVPASEPSKAIPTPVQQRTVAPQTPQRSTPRR